MAVGRPTKPLNITPEEKEKLEMLDATPEIHPSDRHACTHSAGLCRRTEQQCRRQEAVHHRGHGLQMAGTLSAETLEGLLDELRPGAPRSITDAQIEDVVTKTLESMPTNSTHWSTTLMAEKTGLSQTAIVRIWRAFGLQPHRVENFKFCTDP
jgi:hypothetical protein